MLVAAALTYEIIVDTIAASLTHNYSQAPHAMGATAYTLAYPAAITLALSALYTTDTEHREHLVRSMILQLISQRGYSYFNELARTLGVSRATLSWHLSVLMRRNRLKSIRYKRYKLYYLPGRQGVRKLFQRLAREDPKFCQLVRMTIEGQEPERIARKLRVTPNGIKEMYILVKEYMGEALRACS